MSTAVVGATLNDTYKLTRVIGQGGMGVVFEAAHTRVPRRFAVKLLSGEACANPAIFERFQREAEIASSLGSEHITQVFDFNYTDEGRPYMVLELLEGEDLAMRLERGALTLTETVTVVEQVSRALEVAHEHGIVHRDLKPSNIYLCERPGRPLLVKILDFGISKVLHNQSMATRTGLVMGTPSYMAPEQAEGRAGDVDGRTDIFAFGAIIYECLTGKVAFEAPSAVGTIYQVCHVDPTPVREHVPDLPRALDQVVARALSKKREARHPTAGDLRNDFVRACATVGDQTVMLVDHTSDSGARPRTTLSSAASQTTPGEELEERSGAWKLAIGAVALAAAVIVGFVMLNKEPGQEASADKRPAATPVAHIDAGVAAAPSAGDAGATATARAVDAGAVAAAPPDAGATRSKPKTDSDVRNKRRAEALARKRAEARRQKLAQLRRRQRRLARLKRERERERKRRETKPKPKPKKPKPKKPENKLQKQIEDTW